MDNLHSQRYREFAKKLKLARVDAEMTQEQAAQGLKRPQSFISDCERRERRVDFIELLDFVRLYGKPIGYFVPSEDLDLLASAT